MAATPIKGRYVTEDQTFEDVIRKMRDGNIHRVWVSAASVREGRPVPIKVLSQGDVLKQVLKNYSIPPSGTDMDVME
jgi:CBS domain-containing protein